MITRDPAVDKSVWVFRHQVVARGRTCVDITENVRGNCNRLSAAAKAFLTRRPVSFAKLVTSRLGPAVG
jgi:hypothetical protein